MLVRLTHGSRVGEVHDFPPREARAMLDDGRAEPVDGPPARVAVPVEVPVVAHRDPAPRRRRQTR